MRSGSERARDWSGPPARDGAGREIPSEMLTGFNTNIRHRGVLFHVQTEDSGRAHPHVITHLYHGGTILSSEKRGYEDRLEVQDLVGEVKALMEAQHKEMLKRLRRGEFDAVIEERLGAGIFVNAQDVSAQTQPEGLLPPAPEVAPAAASLAPAAPDAPLDELVLDHLVDRALQRARASR